MSAGDPTPLTPPENAAERGAGWKAVDKVKACGGCYCCHNRDKASEGWGTALCGLKPAQEFPKCVQAGKFSADHSRIYGRENVE